MSQVKRPTLAQMKQIVQSEGILLFVIGVPLSALFIGLPLVMVAWAWALATGIRAIAESQRASGPGGAL